MMPRKTRFFTTVTFVLGGALFAPACSDDGSSSTNAAKPGEICATSDNDAIRISLESKCKACHDTGSNQPMFASLDAFETLLVYNTAFVVPGDPDKSKLVALLEGTATGTYTQMPLVGTPYAQLTDKPISMEVVRNWITTLAPLDPAKLGPHPDSPTTRRLRVGELVANMQRTLGYPEVGATDASGGKPSALWVRDPDQLGAINFMNQGAVRTWSALGGGSSLGRVQDDKDMSPGGLRVLTQMSLEWCTVAVNRVDATIFREATETDTSAAAADKIRKNIGYLHLRLLGEAATPEDIDAYFNEVFVPAEPRGNKVAWTEVCAALVRDPRYSTF